MHGRIPLLGRSLPFHENISGTMTAGNSEDSGADDLGCVFIAAESWLAGQPPFCGQPTAPRSPYCPRHRALCRRDPAAPEPRR